MEAIWSYYPHGYVISYVEIEDDEPIIKLKIDMNDRAKESVEISRREYRLPRSMWEDEKQRRISELEPKTKQKFIKRLFEKYKKYDISI